ncbi:hypothetical protein GCM10027188_02700 [Lysobacter humi (ex Lee et al. 2017)]
MSRGTLLATALALAAGSVALVAGIAINHASLQPGWQADGLKTLAMVAMMLAAVPFVARTLRIGTVPCLLAGGLVLAVSGVGPGAVAAVLLVLSASLQVGFLLLAPLRWGAGLRVAVGLAVGLAAFSAVVQALGRLPVHYPAVYVVLALAPFVLRTPATRAGWTALAQLATRAALRSRGLDLALWALAGIGLGTRFVVALAPELGVDALGMHLTMPAIVARDHVWRPADAEFIWGWMPLAVNWLYAVVYPLGGEAAVRLLNWCGDAFALMLAAGAARQWAGRRAGAIAAALLGTFPLLYLLSTTAFVENIWMLWWTAAVVLLGHLQRRRVATNRPYAAAGLLVGAALAAKVITAFWAPLVAWFVFIGWRRGTLSPRAFASVAAVASVVGFWPYASAWIETGNPVFPFFNDVFRSPLFPPHAPFETPFREGIDLRTLYDLTFHTNRYLEAEPGSFGFAWLALLPAGLLAAAVVGRGWTRGVVLVSLAFVALCFVFTAYVRYVAPVFPVWAILVAGGLARIARPLRVAATATTLATGLLGLAFFADSGWWYRAPPPAGPFDRDAYADLVRRMRPEAALVERSNALGLRNVLWIGRGFYPGLRAHVSASNWHQYTGWSALQTRRELDAWIAKRDIDGVVLAADVDPCTTVLCSAMGTLGAPDTVVGTARLYRVRPGTLQGMHARVSQSTFAVERLRDPELTGQAAAWSGSGDWDRDQGRMRVDAVRAFSQGVRVSGGTAYRYRIVARCVGAPGRFRAQINWLRGDGSIIEPVIDTPMCRAGWTPATLDLVAPPEAEIGIAYAIGHDPGVVVEVDSVSLRE